MVNIRAENFLYKKKIWSSFTSLMKMSKSNDQATEKSISKGFEAEIQPQPVTIQPDAVPVMTPMTITQPVTMISTNVPIQTRCCESDGPWWAYCCFGFWLHSFAGLFMNFKLDKNMSQVFKEYDNLIGPI